MTARLSVCRIAIPGGRVTGLLRAMHLALPDHTVTVLERETRDAAARSPDAPVARRSGAPHTVRGHVIMARSAVELRGGLPGVYAALLDAGSGRLDLIEHMPATIEAHASRPRASSPARNAPRIYHFATYLVRFLQAGAWR